VVHGQPEFAAAYANNMFVFADEPNLKAFLLEPKKYLQSEPKLPEKFRLMLTGPKGIGVHTQAQILSELYGLQIVDYQEMVKRRIEELLKEETKLPNNVLPYKSKISLSEAEFDEIKAGRPFPSWKFIPWILDELGHELMKKPPSQERPSSARSNASVNSQQKAANAKAAKAAAAAQAAA
jgi:hypothetical protein